MDWFFWILLVVARGVLWLLSVIKVIEMVRLASWAMSKGTAYRQKFLKLVDQTIADRTLDMDTVRDLDSEYCLPRPLFFQIPRYFAGKPRQQAVESPLRHLDLILRCLERLPVLIFLLAVLLFVVPVRSLIWGEMILVLILIFFQLLDLLVARGMLGFVDNFRRFFESYPSIYYRHPSYTWSKATFTGGFLVAIIGLLGASIIGFGAVYYAVHYISCGTAFRNLLAEIPVQRQLVYFSLVTMATVGYGDIQPGSGLAQFFASLEIVFSIGLVVLFLFVLSMTLTYDKSG